MSRARRRDPTLPTSPTPGGPCSNPYSRPPRGAAVPRSGPPGAPRTPFPTCSGAAAPGGCCPGDALRQADGLLPLRRVAPGREAAAGPRPAPGCGARGRRARSGPERGRDRQPGRRGDRGGRAGAGLRRRQAPLRQEAPPALVDAAGLVLGALVRAAPACARSRRRARAPDRRVEGGSAADGATLGRRSLHEEFSRVGRARAGMARGGARPPGPAVAALRPRGEASRASGAAARRGGWSRGRSRGWVRRAGWRRTTSGWRRPGWR